MASAPPDRIDVLTRRVRWLDRHRRLLSIVLSVVAWFVLSRELAALFQADWPGVGPSLLGGALAAVLWWIIEIAFAWMLAMWETEHDQLARDRGLPRARLVRRK
jgi:hypothetical protein